MEHFLALDLRKLEIGEFVLDDLLEHIPASIAIFAEDINQRVLLQKLPKNILFEALQTVPHLLDIPPEIDLLEVRLEGTVPLPHHPHHLVELPSIHELMLRGLLHVLVLAASLQTHPRHPSAGTFAPELLDDAAVGVAERQYRFALRQPHYILAIE
jgi:hypothetical protein